MKFVPVVVSSSVSKVPHFQHMDEARLSVGEGGGGSVSGTPHHSSIDLYLAQRLSCFGIFNANSHSCNTYKWFHNRSFLVFAGSLLKLTFLLYLFDCNLVIVYDVLGYSHQPLHIPILLSLHPC